MSLGTTKDRMVMNLDWFNVPYRTVYIAGAAAVFLVTALVVAFLFRESIHDLLSPSRREAKREIVEASRLLQEALPYAGDSRAGSLMDNAQVKMREAQQQYDKRNFRDSRTSAIVSQNYSQKLIDLVRGGSGNNREVRFYRIEGEVRVKRAGKFHWEEANLRMQLSIGDQIKTGTGSDAQIIYFDGTITTVRPESLLEIKDLYEEPVSRQRRVSERVGWGEVLTATRKGNVTGSYHEVQSVGASARAKEDAEFRIAYDRIKEKGSVALFTGKVDVATREAQVTMKSGETVAIDRGVLGRIEKLPPSPRLLAPTDQKIYVYPAPQAASTTLAWEPVPEGSRYHLQLAQKVLFSSPLVDKTDVRFSAVELPGLPPNAYYWRVATVDAQGRESPYSPSRKFKITDRALRETADKPPPALALQEVVQNGPVVILTGKTDPDATVWVEGERVEVDEQGGFSTVVRLHREGINKLQIVAQDPAGKESHKTLQAYLESY